MFRIFNALGYLFFFLFIFIIFLSTVVISFIMKYLPFVLFFIGLWLVLKLTNKKN